MKYLFCVAKNGICPVKKYEIIKETPKMYTLNTYQTTRVFKKSMENKYCVFFTGEDAAQTYYEKVKYTPNKPKTNFDHIKAMSVEEMAELYVDLIMQQKCVLGELERTSAVVIEAVRRDLFVHAIAWLESEEALDLINRQKAEIERLTKEVHKQTYIDNLLKEMGCK